jgi:cytochrome c556
MTVAPAIKLLRFVAVATLASAPVIAAAPAPQDIVNARMAGMKKMGAAMKAIGEQLKTATPDKNVVAAAAQTITGAAKAQGKLFPANTARSAGLKTDALPAIWTDRKTFDADMAKLVAESTKLAAVAGTGDTAAIGAQMKAVGATCGACHRQFRAED